MHFKKHFNTAGSHAFLSPSKYAWINYDDEKMESVYAASLAAKRGTELHELAHDLIRLGQKLPRTQATLNRYVNDAIGFRMTPEQILFYSEDAWGTTDAISFRDNLLRIHDLKTGISPASFNQHKVYAALFGLEYHVNPFEIDMEFRIYQNDDVQLYVGEPEEIIRIQEQIKRFSKRLVAMRLEAAGF